MTLFLRVADGNEQDKVVFGEIAVEYKSMIDFETMIVADSALYTAKNFQLMSSIKWLSRVPLSLGKAKELVDNGEHPIFVIRQFKTRNLLRE